MNDSENALLNQAMADTITGARVRAGIKSRKDLAEASGVNFDTVTNIERAKYRISVQQVVAIALAVGMTPQALVAEGWAEFNKRRASVSEASGSNVLPFNPRTAPAEELDENSAEEDRAANAVDDEGGDQPDD